jgi:hypothetical protein
LFIPNCKAKAVGLRPNILCRRFQLNLREFAVVCPSGRCFVGNVISSHLPKRLKSAFGGEIVDVSSKVAPNPEICYATHRMTA